MKKTVRQKTLEKAIELFGREIRRYSPSAAAAHQGFEFGIRAKAKVEELKKYREELEQMLNPQTRMEI